MPPELKRLLSNRKDLTSNCIVNKLNKGHIKPITPLNELRKIAKRNSKRHGVLMTVSRDMLERRYNKADGITGLRVRDKKVVIHLHPILKYYPKSYTKNVIEHELDHAKIIKRSINK
jgi:hypothetical protein